MSNTVIIGAGIIGCSTAYYLSESSLTPANTIHLVEASPQLFKCASGLAGGFLAKDWFSPQVASLGALSFKLHRDIARKYNGKEKWLYSASTATSLTHHTSLAGTDWIGDGSSRATTAGVFECQEVNAPSWLMGHKGGDLEVISSDGTVAQVDPKRLCEFLLGECRDRGVVLHQPARVGSVSVDSRGEIAGVRIEEGDGRESDIPCTRLVITAGAWSPQVFKSLFPSSPLEVPITPLAGHSIVLRSPRWLKEHENQGCHAVFSSDVLGFSPEMFSRYGGEIYLAGLNSTDMPLPKLATDAKTKGEDIKRLKDTAAVLLGIPGEADDLEVIREGFCFRPVTANGRPIITRIPDSSLGDGFSTRGGVEKGVFLSAGHGPWGISLSLGTGKVLSELLEDQPCSADISALGI